MAEITLVKHADVPLTDIQRGALRAYLFEQIGGLGEQDQRRWNWLWNHVKRMGEGETFQFKTIFRRHGPFHRYHMLLESRVFDAQERIKDFEQFRLWLKLGAGYVDWMAGPKGGVVPVPKSISYEQCEESEMREFHGSAVEFLRSAHACKYLWPALSPIAAGQAMDTVLATLNA